MDTPANKIKILVVDDALNNLKTIQALLENEYDIFLATDGEKALQIARTQRPDIILLDIMMPPGIDGYEVCRRLKADPMTNPIRVLFISAKDDIKDEVKGIMLGASEYIMKPIEPTLLKVRIMEHTRRIMAIQRLHNRIAELEQRLAQGSLLAQQAMNGQTQTLPMLIEVLKCP
jgi:PleD family two-component response regulator